MSDLSEALETWEDFLHSAHGCDFDEPVAIAILRINHAARKLLSENVVVRKDGSVHCDFCLHVKSVEEE